MNILSILLAHNLKISIDMTRFCKSDIVEEFHQPHCCFIFFHENAQNNTNKIKTSKIFQIY